MSVSGFISGNVFTPEGSTKEVVNLKLVSCKVKELADGEKAEHTVEMETRVSYLREFGENGIGGSCSKSFPYQDDYKYINFGFSGNREKLNLSDGDIVQVKGFLSADFFTPEGTEKEIAKAKIVFLEATKVDKDGENSSAPATAKKDDVPEVDVDEDEIPF